MRPIWPTILLVLVGSGIYGYCTTRGKIDTEDAEAKIRKAFDTTIAPVDKVQCPEASRKKGTTFECTVTFNGGGTYRVKIEIYGDDGEWKPAWTTPIRGAEKTAADIQEGFASQAPGIQVDCGKGVFEVPQEGYVCSAINAKGSHHIRVKYDPKTEHVLYSPEP